MDARENRFNREVQKMEHKTSRSRSRSQKSFKAAEEESAAIAEIIASDKALCAEVNAASEAIGEAARAKLNAQPVD